MSVKFAPFFCRRLRARAQYGQNIVVYISTLAMRTPCRLVPKIIARQAICEPASFRAAAHDPGEGEDVDPGRPGATQHARAFADRRPGREDVVDDDEAPP